MADYEAIFDAMEVERLENERLKRDDPAAYRRKMEAKLPTTRCAMCSVDFKGYGNSGDPIVAGMVCGGCNVQVVKKRFAAATRREDA
jgi:hypothetical protein